jgi:hypothetical protein
MVAAMMSYRYLVEMRSAALRKTAARSLKGRASQAGLAARAASMAAETSAVVAVWYEATVVAWSAGFCCLERAEALICEVLC